MFEQNNVRSLLYTSSSATKTAQKAVRSNFDAGCNEDEKNNEYDVLVATDAISEGFSLHRAGTIYNYDIPYNPTRVIQRVGRINRINKKVFDELFIYNFFPTATGESISRTTLISTFKMQLFQSILGSDTQILTADESIEGYLGDQFLASQNEDNIESWDVAFRNELYAIESQQPDLFKEAINLPYRCRVARNKTVDDLVSDKEYVDDLFGNIENEGVLLFSKKGDSHRFVFTSKVGNSIILDPELALLLFKSDCTEKGFAVSDNFYPLYEHAKESTGVLKVSIPSRGVVSKARERLHLLEVRADNASDKQYLSGLRTILDFNSLPIYYVKKLANIPINLDAIKDVKLLIPPTYVKKLHTKESEVTHAPETVLLAEELLEKEKE